MNAPPTITAPVSRPQALAGATAADTGGAPSLASLLSASSTILIDFHGALSDDADLLDELISEVASAELGVPVQRTPYFEEFAGDAEEFMFRLFSGLVSDARIDELVDSFNRGYLRRIHERSPIPLAARDFIVAARALGKSVAVIAASSTDIVVPALNQADLLSEIDLVVAPGGDSAPELGPEARLRALELLGAAPEDAVAFEGSRPGLAAATRSGLATVLVDGHASAPADGRAPASVGDRAPIPAVDRTPAPGLDRADDPASAAYFVAGLHPGLLGDPETASPSPHTAPEGPATRY